MPISHINHQKNLSMVKKLNSQLTASIQTRYGPTREIKIRDSIRQGGVLSVIEYAILIDEISKEIRKRGLGLLTKTGNKVDSLLWMDDVCLIHHDQDKSGVKRLHTLGHLDQYMAQHGRIVKQSRWRFCLIQIKHYSTRGPIPLWLCVPHVHWCRDCETVSDQHWNKPGTVSQSQCTAP